MSKNDRTFIWVDPTFKRRLKMKAAKENCTMLELTKNMAREGGDPEDLLPPKPKKRRIDFDFRI